MQNLWSITGRSIAVSALALALTAVKACAVQNPLRRQISRAAIPMRLVLL